METLKQRKPVEFYRVDTEGNRKRPTFSPRTDLPDLSGLRFSDNESGKIDTATIVPRVVVK